MKTAVIPVGKLYQSQISMHAGAYSSAALIVLAEATSISRCRFYRENGRMTWPASELSSRLGGLMSGAMVADKLRKLSSGPCPALKQAEGGGYSLVGEPSGRFINIVRPDSGDLSLQRHSAILLFSYLLDKAASRARFDGDPALPPSALENAEAMLGLSHKSFISALKDLLAAGLFALTDELGIAADSRIRIRFKGQVLRADAELLEAYMAMFGIVPKGAQKQPAASLSSGQEERIGRIVEDSAEAMQEIRDRMIEKVAEVMAESTAPHERQEKKRSAPGIFKAAASGEQAFTAAVPQGGGVNAAYTAQALGQGKGKGTQPGLFALWRESRRIIMKAAGSAGENSKIIKAMLVPGSKGFDFNNYIGRRIANREAA